MFLGLLVHTAFRASTWRAASMQPRNKFGERKRSCWHLIGISAQENEEDDGIERDMYGASALQRGRPVTEPRTAGAGDWGTMLEY